MAKLNGSSTAEIDAPLEQVWELVADVERAPDWQGGLKALEALERDDEGRATLCESETDAKIRSVRSIVRFDYRPPTQLRWEQVKGELKSVDGTWELEELSDGRTRATYWLEVDLGRALGLLIRGPLVGVLRGQLVNSMPEKLKRFIESGAA